MANKENRHVTRIADWMPPLPAAETEYHRLDGLPEEEDSCSKQVGSCVKSHIAILKWLPTYDFKSNLFNDLSGGVTIALICLVQTLAHAAIATTSIYQGPYCALVPPFIYAVLGTSPHASISSGAIAAILIADQLSGFPDIQDRTELASVLALTSGVVLVVLGLCKFAFLVRFLSQSVLSGFITGGSILILIGQAGNFFGIETMPHGVPPMVTLKVLSEKVLVETNKVSLILGIFVLMFLEVSMRLRKRIVTKLRSTAPNTPGLKWLKLIKMGIEMKELIIVFLGILFAWSTSSLDDEGETSTLLPTIGVIPSGLPPFKPPWDMPATRRLLFESKDIHVLHRFGIASFLVAVTTFLTTYSTAKKQALKHGYQLDGSQEMFALGMASTCGSFFGAFPPSGSLSRTSLASEVGVKTQMSTLMQMFVVGGSLKFFTGVLYFLPKTALASIVIRSTWNMIDLDTPRELMSKFKPRREGGFKRDLGVWFVAFFMTIYMGVIWGVGCAVIISVIMIVKDAARPRMVVLGRRPGSLDKYIWRDKEVWPEGESEPGVLVIEFRGSLSFASADWFQEEIERIRLQNDELNEKTHGQKVKVVVLNLSSVHDIDPTAVAMLKDLLEAWQGSVSCIVANAKSRVRMIIQDELGEPKNGKPPLLTQQAFIISLDEAVQLALSRIQLRKVSSDVITKQATM